jgi:transglutaminase-like putative cysteine protease
MKVLLILLCASCCQVWAQPLPLSKAAELEAQGRLRDAAKLLDDYLSTRPDMALKDREKLAFAAERLRRLPLDYPLAEDQVYQGLLESIPDLARTEFLEWERQGRFDHILVEGEKHYHYASRSNLFFRYPELRRRRIDKEDESAFETAMLGYCRRIKEAGARSTDRFVLPQRFRATMTMTVAENKIPAGETVRCWLPYPRSYPFQSDMEIIEAVPAVKVLAQPQSPIRSVYLEQQAEFGKPVEFSVQFEFTSWATCPIIVPDQVQPYNTRRGEFIQYTAEESPHILFTPELKALARQIIGRETNPYHKARRLYDWVSANMRYSYMIEYSLIDNLSMYAYRHRYGDCGVQALLFITLCRISGVPARWQGCWMFFPGEKTIHDWAEFYIEPYGWLPCDPYEGSWAMHDATTLSESERNEIKDFYFGNMSAFRMVANSETNAALYPPKNSFRADKVDFQRGEVEWGAHDLYFNERSFTWKVEPVQ